MSEITFNVTLFRAQFPAFSSAVTYPDLTLSGYFTASTNYISPKNYGWIKDDKRVYALNLMTAHLTALSDIILAGGTPQLVSASSIDKVSVSLVPPEAQNQWQWWLSTTPYGVQLLALLQVNTVGGFYIGGSQVTSGFRRWGRC